MALVCHVPKDHVEVSFFAVKKHVLVNNLAAPLHPIIHPPIGFNIWRPNRRRNENENVEELRLDRIKESI